jgi:hypothetical protein
MLLDQTSKDTGLPWELAYVRAEMGWEVIVRRMLVAVVGDPKRGSQIVDCMERHCLSPSSRRVEFRF